MQNLYYDSGSNTLRFVDELQREIIYQNIDNLLITGSPDQIIAYSGSQEISFFPVDMTNIFMQTLPSSSNNQNEYYNINWYLYVSGSFTEDELNGTRLHIYDGSGDLVLSYRSNNSGNYVSNIGSNVVSNVKGSGSYTSSMQIYDTNYQIYEPQYYIYTGSNINNECDWEFVPKKDRTYIITTSIWN